MDTPGNPSPGDHSMAEVIEIPMSRVRPNPFQPRVGFRESELAELARSLESLDLIQPIIVRRTGEAYQIACGERRWRAAQLAGWSKIPSIIRQLDDRQLQLYSLVENFHRQNLSSSEREKAIYDLWGRHYSSPGGKAALARDLGVSESTVQDAIYAHQRRREIGLEQADAERITTDDLAKTRGIEEAIADRALEAKAKGEIEARELEDLAPVLRRSDTAQAQEFLEDYVAEKKAVRSEVDRARRIVEGTEPSKELRRQLSVDERRLEDFAETYAKIRFWSVASVEMIDNAGLRRKATEYVAKVVEHCTALSQALEKRAWR